MLLRERAPNWEADEPKGRANSYAAAPDQANFCSKVPCQDTDGFLVYTNGKL